ncbi:hypothetical protein BX600DRAFT_522089 [Xylariales sp. PMI_506]|nr:hypothetical protein BX600DRAFT_522089 [Xylariales sp. PMI_506]
MIGTSLSDLLFIRAAIFLIQYATPICLVYLAILTWLQGRGALGWRTSQVLIAYSVIEVLYAAFIWAPYTRRLKDEAKHPPPLPAAERDALFDKCLDNVPNFEGYMRLWFLGSPLSDIRRENAREFLLWGFFDQGAKGGGDPLSAEDEAQLNRYLDVLEERLGRKLEPGRGAARSLRLTHDAVETSYRTWGWHVCIVAAVDAAAHWQLARQGLEYHARARARLLATIPWRLQDLWAPRRSVAPDLSYWYRRHTAAGKRPVVLLHGLGIGLWTYVQFVQMLQEESAAEGGQIGVIALEILPISFRFTEPPLARFKFLDQLRLILDAHGWDDFVAVGHSYGTGLVSSVVRSPDLGPRCRSIILIDPISLMLHLPDVAYNFTRRKPRRANEWLIWYFAAMDPGIAHTLGRHFFWKENLIWKEELLGTSEEGDTVAQGGGGPRSSGRRKVAVCLSELDLLVNTTAVADYLTAGEGWRPGRLGPGSAGKKHPVDRHTTRDGIDILWYRGLDHGQSFDTRHALTPIVSLVQEYCTRVD